MPFVQIPGLNVHYEVAGKGDVVIVLAHGNFASWRWWRPLLDRLPRGHRAYAPDLRGCGDTARPPVSEDYTIEQLAADLHHFAVALKLPPFHVVGHSLGGAVAMQSALEHPDRVRSLTLVAPAPAEGLPLLRVPDSSPLLSLFDVRDATLAALDALYRFWHSLDANRPALRQALKRLMPTLAYDDAFEALVDDAGRMAPQAVVGHLRALDTWNKLNQLGRLDQPALVLWGEQDVLIPRDAVERTARGLRHGRLVTWPDVGHSPQLEQPDRFARLLLNFVGEQQTSALPGSGWLRALWGRLRSNAMQD